MTGTTRRTFLHKTIAGVMGAILESGLSCRSATGAGEPNDGTIIDTHVHFYDPTRPQGVPWPGKNDRLLYRPFLPKHFKELTKPQKVTGTVVVECSPWLEDNQWVLDQAKDDPFVVGLIGHLTPGEGDYRKHLERFAKDRLFRGVRVIHNQLQKGLGQARFIEDLKLLAERDLALDVNGNPKLLPDVPRLAERLPNLRIVINHAANVLIDGKAPDRGWLDGVRAAAKSPNVYCKVSALVEGTRKRDGNAPKEMRFYKPVLDALWDNFGENRLLYGSNWPVSQHFATYTTVFGIVSEYFGEKGKMAAEKFFGRNSQAAYKWVKR